MGVADLPMRGLHSMVRPMPGVGDAPSAPLLLAPARNPTMLSALPIESARGLVPAPSMDSEASRRMAGWSRRGDPAFFSVGSVGSELCFGHVGFGEPELDGPGCISLAQLVPNVSVGVATWQMSPRGATA